jgi:hypothetical protein
MAVPVVTYQSEIWAITGKEEGKVGTAEVKRLRSAADYTRVGQIMSPKIREELNIFNLKNKI